MLKIFFFFFFFIFPLFAFASENHLVAGCRVMSRNGSMIATFPGRICSFLDDGRVLSMSSTHLRMFENDGKIDWEMKLPAPLSSYAMGINQKKILLLSMKPGDLPGDPMNYFLDVLDLNGYRIRTMDTFTLFGLEKQVKVTDFRETSTGYFISLYGDGVYFLDEYLKLTKKKITLGPRNEVERVSLTPEENFFYLVRPASNESARDPVVYVEEFDVKKNKPTFRWPSQKSVSFYFTRGGSVSLTGNSYIINHPVSGSYIVTRKTGKLADYITQTHFDINQIRIPEEVILTDLSKFFERWKF